jgi:hypothetical protein
VWLYSLRECSLQVPVHINLPRLANISKACDVVLLRNKQVKCCSQFMSFFHAQPLILHERLHFNLEPFVQNQWLCMRKSCDFFSPCRYSMFESRNRMKHLFRLDTMLHMMALSHKHKGSEPTKRRCSVATYLPNVELSCDMFDFVSTNTAKRAPALDSCPLISLHLCPLCPSIWFAPGSPEIAAAVPLALARVSQVLVQVSSVSGTEQNSYDPSKCTGESLAFLSQPGGLEFTMCDWRSVTGTGPSRYIAVRKPVSYGFLVFSGRFPSKFRVVL